MDDTTTVERCNKDQAIRHVQASGSTEFVPAVGTNNLIDCLSGEAAAIDMKVNAKKTQLLCISADNGYRSDTAITTEGTTIQSQEEVKLLGFVLGNTTGVHGQVAAILTKFRRKFWSLIHLRRAGIRGKNLFSLYESLVRPVIEANCVIYHPMLTKSQKAAIEKLQKLVVWLCYGPCHYVEKLIQVGHDSLDTRRDKAVRKFVAKSMQNERFARKWYKPRQAVQTDLRCRRPFIETKAKTERYYRSPLLTFQRIANDLSTENAR